MSLELLPTFVMAVLASWLGLGLLARSPRIVAAQVFAWLCLHVTVYALCSVLLHLSASPQIKLLLAYLQVIETVLLPAVWLHFITIITRTSLPRRVPAGALVATYAVGTLMALYAVASPSMQVAGDDVRFPAGPLGVVWTLQRTVPLLVSLVLVGMSYRAAADSEIDRRRRAVFGVAVLIGVAGALWSSLERWLHTPLALSHILWDVALLLMAYSVLAYRMLLPARVAQRALYRSLLGGALTAAYVGGLLLFEPWISRTLAISAPVVSVFAVVLLITLFGPVRELAGAWIDRRFFHREFDYGQMIQAFSADLLERGSLRDQLEAALQAICGTLGVPSGVVLANEATGMRPLAQHGVVQLDAAALYHAAPPAAAETRFDDWPAWPHARLLLPLRKGEQTLGLLVLSRKRSGEPYQDLERELLDSLSRYLALAIHHAQRQQDYETAIAAVAEQTRQLQSMESLLATQISELAAASAAPPVASPAETAPGMRVYALGPLRVERDGRVIERWGGDKAGSKQAEALFAFLFDRRGKGVTKDEAEEVIWPDLDLDKADMSFHRTLGGLRRTLEPGLQRGNQSRTITYHHERYWLAPDTVGWSDVEAFQQAVQRGHTLLRQDDMEAAREQFQRAVDGYRGDYMDDCPMFGDSAYVEERRAALCEQASEALLALGTVYERLGQAGEAAACFRRAISSSADGCPRAAEGLARLQVVVGG